jgi:hypothetical protein
MSKDSIRITQSMLRCRNIESTMKYTAASEDDMQKALVGLNWGELHRTIPSSRPPLRLRNA